MNRMGGQLVLAVMRRIIGLAGVVTLSACQAMSPPSASPSVAAPEPVELTATTDPLPPGIYTRSAFDPHVTFELGEGWRAVQLLDGFFDVQRDVGTPDV